MKNVTYCLYREGYDFVAQCLKVDVSSFGASRVEAVANLREALELYFGDGPQSEEAALHEVPFGMPQLAEVER